MSFFSWLGIGSYSAAIKRPSRQWPARKPAAFRPRLETLEGRDVPSTLLVTSPKDHGAGTLRAAIADANPNDVIVLSPKLDGKTITLTSGELDITKNLTIQGPGANQLAVSGGDGSRVFEVTPNVTVTLSGLTITGGDGRAMGYISTNSVNGYGGGIYNAGALTVSDCAVSKNGGFSDSVTTQVGGGIYNEGTLTISGGTVSGNSAYAFGGGIDNEGTLTVSGAVISDNNAADGGGICNFYRATVSSSTVSNNIAADYGGPGSGGGIYNAGTMTVTSCYVQNNFDSTTQGGGIYNAGTAAALTVSGSTFSGNRGGDIYGPYTDGGGNSFS
jgi:hypothetical protein